MLGMRYLFKGHLWSLFRPGGLVSIQLRPPLLLVAQKLSQLSVHTLIAINAITTSIFGVI